MSEDYTWKFTADSFIDGTIFGGGIPKTKHCVVVNVTFMPYELTEDLEKQFDRIGYDAGLQEIPNAKTREPDIKLFATGPYPLFTSKTLPRYRERRLIIDEAPIEFIKGFFTVSIKVNLNKYSRDFFDNDVIMIRTALPKDDVLQLLLRLGIEEYIYAYNHVYIERETFRNIEPFERFYQCYLKEDKFFGIDEGKEYILRKEMKRIQDEIWDGKIVENKNNFQY
jgi:hypothetical protein